MDYDLIILGGGPAGYLAGERAGAAGLKTLVIEKAHLGGVCLNEGCIPSKTLLHSAKVYDYATKGEKYGVQSEKVVYDHQTVVNRKNEVVKALVSGVEVQLKHCETDVVKGLGRILGQVDGLFEIQVDAATYRGKRLLIATGSQALMPPIPGLQEAYQSGFAMTNREVLDLNEIPDRLVVIGGGVIGLEMASYFNSVGSDVTVIEMMEKIAGPNDDEISNILLNNYKRKGIRFELGSRVTQFEKDGLLYEKSGEIFSIKAGKVLVSIGRRPVIQGYGLENIGVYTENGHIKVDPYGRTNVVNVYAAGDVNGQSMLAHTAYREAEVAVNHMLGKRDQMRYHAIPSVIYTNPEVAAVGMTEAMAEAKGIDYETTKLSMQYSGRYLAENSATDGMCKVIIDKKRRTIIGAHMIGSYVSEIINSVSIMIETEMRIDDVKEIVFPHPTVSEIVRENIFRF